MKRAMVCVMRLRFVDEEKEGSSSIFGRYVAFCVSLIGEQLDAGVMGGWGWGWRVERI